MATYLGKIPDTLDHVPAVRNFATLACLAYFPGAIGDCVRPADHSGSHQGAHLYAWKD